MFVQFVDDSCEPFGLFACPPDWCGSLLACVLAGHRGGWVAQALPPLVFFRSSEPGSGRQTISLHEAMGGRLMMIWADLRSVHVTVDGHVVWGPRLASARSSSPKI